MQTRVNSKLNQTNHLYNEDDTLRNNKSQGSRTFHSQKKSAYTTTHGNLRPGQFGVKNILARNALMSAQKTNVMSMRNSLATDYVERATKSRGTIARYSITGQNIDQCMSKIL